MRALDLDFRRSGRRLKWSGVLCLALSVAAAVLVGAQYRQMSGDIEQVESAMHAAARATRAQAPAPRSEGSAQKLGLQLKHANDLLHQLNVPWGELLGDVEAASIADVALLSIDSDVERRRINISGEAKDLSSMVRYVRSLQARPALTDIYLESHEVQEQDPQHPVRFVLSANWQVAGAQVNRGRDY